MGEGTSMGPYTAEMKSEEMKRQGDIQFDIPWTTLGEYLDHIVERGDRIFVTVSGVHTPASVGLWWQWKKRSATVPVSGAERPDEPDEIHR